jgi:hypothetical protein
MALPLISKSKYRARMFSSRLQNPPGFELAKKIDMDKQQHPVTILHKMIPHFRN